MVDQRFPSKFRLQHANEFQRVFRHKLSVADPLLVVHGCANQLAYPRLGLSVSRRVGNAVVRNQWKRRLREAFRRHRDELPPGIDLVIIPRQGVKPTYAAVVTSLLRLAHQLELRLRWKEEK